MIKSVIACDDYTGRYYMLLVSADQHVDMGWVNAQFVKSLVCILLILIFAKKEVLSAMSGMLVDNSILSLFSI